MMEKGNGRLILYVAILETSHMLHPASCTSQKQPPLEEAASSSTQLALFTKTEHITSYLGVLGSMRSKVFIVAFFVILVCSLGLR